MICRSIAAAAVALFSACAAQAQGNANVNINVWTQTLDRHLITEVVIGGPGGGVFLYPDPMTGPDLTDPDGALDTALAALGLPLATPLGPLSDSIVGTDSTFQKFVDTGGAVFGTDYLGDPDDYTTWIAIGTEDIDVRIDLITTNYTYYRLQTTILTTAPAAVPLPAAGLLLLGGLGAFAGLRRRVA